MQDAARVSFSGKRQGLSQCGPWAGITSSTKRDTANWEHENINGSCSGVIVESGGRARYYEHLDGQATEALVRTWLNAKAGISP